MDPTLQRSIFTLRRWWWLIVLVPLVAGAAAYFVTRQAVEKTYVGRATVMVGQTTAPASDLEEARLSQSLVPTYAALARKNVVLAPVVEKLNLSSSPEDLASSISTETPKDTQLIEVTVHNRESAQAVRIANAVADQLVALGNEMAGPDQVASEARIADLNKKIADAETQVESLSSQYALAVPLPSAGSPSPTGLSQGDILLGHISLLQSNVRMWREALGDLTATVAGGGASAVTVLESATTAKAGNAHRTTQNALFGAVGGLLLAVFLAFFLDYADDHIRTGEDVRRLGLPALAAVRTPNRRRRRDSLARLKNGVSAEFSLKVLGTATASGTYGRLYARLVGLSRRESHRMWTITSPESGDGVTTTALGLALVAVEMGRRVILVDANWSSPELSRRLQLPNDRGLSALASNRVELRDLLVSTPIPGLSAVAAGPQPLHGQRLLSSEGLQRAVRRLAEAADLVIVDAPAVLGEMDISALATGSDGTVLVVRAASTRQGAAREARDTLAAAGAPVLGVVLTNASSHDGVAWGPEEPEGRPQAVAVGADWRQSGSARTEERS